MDERFGYRILDSFVVSGFHCSSIKRRCINLVEPNGFRWSSIFDEVFSFNDVEKAMEYSESGRAKGKIILKIR